MRRLAAGLRGPWRPVLAVVAAIALTSVTPSCRPDTVRVAFRPRIGTRYHYVVKVRSVTTTRLAGADAQRTVDSAVLRAEHVVLAAGAEGVRVRVLLERAGSSPRTFVVRFDRAAQLEELETIEGLPASVLGGVDLPEIFPGAVGAPPNRPLAAGERWQTHETVRLADGRQVQVEGDGRLVELGVVDGRKLATIRTETRLPVTSASDVRGGRLALEGTEVSGITASRDLADGSVRTASSVTRGTFSLALTPLEGSVGPTLHGSLGVEVRSQTRRVR